MDTRQAVAAYCYSVLAKQSPNWAPRHFAELAPGVIVVEDEEYNVYFDRTRWQYTRPDIWEESNLIQPFGLGILPGAGRIPPVRAIVEMARFAQQHLSPTSSFLEWYPEPEYFEL